MKYRIYLVEDEKKLNNVLASYLEKEGWQVTQFYTGIDARKAISDQPDLWILDIMLPEMDGYQLISEIKAETPDLPVIFISARDEGIDRIIGLEKGSDDYLAKPFLPQELVIRSRKLLERIYGEKTLKENSKKVIYSSSYEILLEKRLVFQIDGQQRRKIDLTSREMDFLFFLCNNEGQALSRNQILDNVWGTDYFGSDRIVDDFVRRLRKKMPELNIETLYGYGYRMILK